MDAEKVALLESADEPTTPPVPLTEAIDGAGFGRFHVALLALCGLGYGRSLFSTHSLLHRIGY
jgi:hypothetical protein